jgi:hypothetical protein
MTYIDVKVRMNHDGEINRARYMPQNNVSLFTLNSNSLYLTLYITIIPKNKSKFAAIYMHLSISVLTNNLKFH